ncbi:hypothetical protein Ssi03_35730 [Sphaerisporangium siamense]|nr:hypothetical protein Ssi03_35730 [Sphaerisporangium siamense]
MPSDIALINEFMTGDGVIPHPRRSLSAIPGRMLDELDRAARGIVVLAVDGLSWRTARESWRDAALETLTSTFPSTSATAWMTAVTGVPLTGHLVAGAACRSPADDALVDLIHGTVLAGPRDAPEPVAPGRPASPDVLVRHPTVFETAASRARAAVLAREVGALGGPWADALLQGAERIPGPGPRALAADAADPVRMAEAVAGDVEAALTAHRADVPLLLWTYVNLDEHVHRHGYDARARRAVEQLERHARSWARRGWTVLAHADHGQTPCAPDPELEAAWARVDTPELCRLPAGGAGRVRWLYPREGRTGEVRERLAAALDGHALVVPVDDLPGLGLTGLTPALRERIGGVVALATSPGFPLPVAGVAWEHGALSPDEMLVPLAVWR